MPDYRRAYQPGGTFFFTVVTAARRPLFAEARNRELLHAAITESARARPVDWLGIVLLPDHLHALWQLPRGDADFSTRWASIKAGFTRRYLAACGSEIPQASRSERGHGVWQERFWEHQIRDQQDLNRHLDYIHYNPVKHGLASCPHAWAHSSFNRWVASGAYDADRLCNCAGRVVAPPDFCRLASLKVDSQ